MRNKAISVMKYLVIFAGGIVLGGSLMAMQIRNTENEPILKVDLPVLVGYPDGDFKQDYITKDTTGNLHDWLVKTVLENATSANLTWNYTAFKEYGTLTVNWEK